MDLETDETTVCIKGQDYMQRYTYNEYTVLDEPPISQTNYTSIHLCQLNHTFEKFVMKQLRRGYMRKVDREAYLNSMREIDIHKMIKHKNVVNLRCIIDDSADDKVYLVMEYAGMGQVMNFHEESGRFLPSRPGKPILSEQEIKNYCV